MQVRATKKTSRTFCTYRVPIDRLVQGRRVQLKERWARDCGTFRLDGAKVGGIGSGDEETVG